MDPAVGEESGEFWSRQVVNCDSSLSAGKQKSEDSEEDGALSLYSVDSFSSPLHRTWNWIRAWLDPMPFDITGDESYDR